MNKLYLLGAALAALAAPFAQSHAGGGGVNGTPKLYCEDVWEDTDVHDYSMAGVALLAGAVDGSEPPCPYDPQWDGHYEWAVGGAWLLACDTGCATPSGGMGEGALGCWGTYADHAPYPDVWVVDQVLTFSGLPVPFIVAADYRDNSPRSPHLPPKPSCGDFDSDTSIACVDFCTVAFPPGRDGSYQVYVCEGTLGHVTTSAPSWLQASTGPSIDEACVDSLT